MYRRRVHTDSGSRGEERDFLNVAQEGGADFVKVALADVPARTAGAAGIRRGDFVEVAAQFLGTVTHVGGCPAVVD